MDEQEKKITGAHGAPVYQKTSGGSHELAGPLSVEGFRGSKIYKALSEEQRQGIEEQLAVEAFKADDVRIVVQSAYVDQGKSSVRLQEDRQYRPERVHIGTLSGLSGPSGDEEPPHHGVNVNVSYNLETNKASRIDDNEHRLELILDNDTRFPNQRNADDFIKKVLHLQDTDNLSQHPVSEKNAVLAAALKNGASASVEDPESGQLKPNAPSGKGPTFALGA